MVDPEDLVTLGKVLDQIEEINKSIPGSSLVCIQDLNSALQKIAEKIILRECEME